MVQVEAAAVQKSTVERQGKSLEGLPDASLFFIDKVCGSLKSATKLFAFHLST